MPPMRDAVTGTSYGKHRKISKLRLNLIMFVSPQTLAIGKMKET